jgi:TatD DNase family protein
MDAAVHWELPGLGAPVADAHAHLDMLEDPVGALERAALAGVGFVTTIVYPGDPAELASIELLAGWLEEAQARLVAAGVRATVPRVALSVGAHPHEAKDFDDEAFDLIKELISGGRAVAVGETGLDFHYDHSPREDQRRAFRTQLSYACEADLPVIVHLREAHDEGLSVLRDIGIPKAGCVLHCFSEGPGVAEGFLELGCHVSFAGTVTFKKADAIREAARLVPIERLLVETDCPFLAPEPYRGRKNEPALTVLTAAAVADAKGVERAELAARAYENTLGLFGGGKEPEVRS